MASRVRRRLDGLAPLLRSGSLAEEETSAIVSLVNDEGDGDSAFEGLYSAYNLSNSSLASGTIAPWSIRASRYCEALYAMNTVPIQ